MKKHSIAILLAAAFLPGFAVADEAPKEGWSGVGEAGMAMSRGNSRSENVNANLAFTNLSGAWKHDVFMGALRTKGEVMYDPDGPAGPQGPTEFYETTADRFQIGGSSAYNFDERMYGFGALRYDEDDFAGYDYQAIASVGLGYYLIKNDMTTLSAEFGPGYRQIKDRISGDKDSEMIGRGKIDFKHKLTDNTELFNTLLVEAGSDNTFAQNDVGLSVAMSEAFALKAGYQIRRNSDVPVGIKNNDTLTTLNLVYNFK